MVTGRANFPKRGCVQSTSRSTSEPNEVPLLLQRLAPFLPAAAGPSDTAALLCLRICRAESCIAGCHPAELRPGRNVWPPPTLSRLAIGDWLARSRSLSPSDLCAPLRGAKPFRRFPSGSTQQISNLRYAKQARRAISARSSLQNKLTRSRLSALLFPRFTGP